MPAPALQTDFQLDMKAIMRLFNKLPDKVARNASRKAVNFGATPIVRAIRDRVQVDTGLTKKSIGKKTIVYKRDESAVAIIGARKKFMETSHGHKHVPYHIFHLLDRGHVARDGSFVPGSMAVDKGSKAAKHQAISRMARKLNAEIQKEAAQL